MKKFELSEEKLDLLIEAVDYKSYCSLDPKVIGLLEKLTELKEYLQEEDEEES